MLEDGSGFIHPEASVFTFFFFLKKIFIYLAVPGSLIFSVDMWDI